MARGYGVKETADHLALSKRTVEVHKQNAYKKMGVSNVAEAVRIAIYAGFDDETSFPLKIAPGKVF